MQDRSQHQSTPSKHPHGPEDDMSIKLHHAELLLNVSKTMAAFDVLDEMLMSLVEITTAEMNADRGTIFLNDSETDELYSIIAQGNIQREIRVLNNSGVAGRVFTKGKGMIVHDAYTNEYFNPSIDEETGYVTRSILCASILCAPIKTVKGEIIGVAQMLNKKERVFTEEDLLLLEAMTTQAAIALQNIQIVDRMKRSRKQEMEFFDVVSDITSEIDLGALLQKVMFEATKMLSTLAEGDVRGDQDAQCRAVNTFSQ